MTAEFGRLTPSGHCYDEPTTIDEIERLSTDNAQAIIESWDANECPPTPTWPMINTLLATNYRLRVKNDRQARSLATMMDIISKPDAPRFPAWAEVALGSALAVMGYLVGVSR